MNENLVVEMVDGDSYEFVPLGKHIVRAVGVCGGRPTFKYTRVEVSGVLDRLAQGDSIAQIVEAFRGRIPAEAVSEAIELANRLFVSTYASPTAAGSYDSH